MLVRRNLTVLCHGAARRSPHYSNFAIRHLPSSSASSPLPVVRHSTFWHSLQTKMQDKQALKEEEQFQVEIKRLATLERYNLQSFKDAIDSAEKNSWFSWVNKMPGVKSMPEVQQGEKYKKILAAFKGEELRDPTSIKAREKQRIAAETGETVQEINLLLKLYENSRGLHSWLRRRVIDKKELPKTRSECQVLMMGDPAGISMSQIQQKQQQRAKKRGGRISF